MILCFASAGRAPSCRPRVPRGWNRRRQRRRDTGDDAIEVCDDFRNYFNECSWRRAAALLHGKPLDVDMQNE